MQFRCLLAGMALAVGGASLTACDGGDDSATPLTDPSTTTTTDSTTTTAPTTSTTLDFETEVKLAALALIEVRNQNLMNPDEARVDDYIGDFCVCREAEFGFIRDFIAEGSRWAGPAIVPLGIRLDSRDPNGPSFTLIARQPAGVISSPTGDRPVPEIEPAPYFIALARADDGTWRINGLDEVPIPPDAALRIIEEEGLP